MWGPLSGRPPLDRDPGRLRRAGIEGAGDRSEAITGPGFSSDGIIDAVETVVDTYLDPTTGQSLVVDVRPEEASRTFTTMPARWGRAER